MQSKPNASDCGLTQDYQEAMDPLVGLFDPTGDDGELCEMPESLPPEVCTL